MTLNQIAENIAYKLGDQFNDTLQQSIKDTLIVYRAKYIRDDLDRNTLSDQHFIQTLNIPLIEVNLLEELDAEICHVIQKCNPNKDNEKILRSKYELPISVRIKNWGKNIYKFLGTSNHKQSFVLTTLDSFEFTNTLPYQDKTIQVAIINNYLYILNNTDICGFALSGIFEDPREVAEKCGNSFFSDETRFPIGADMLMSISTNIVNGEYPLLGKDGEQINIKPDDKE